MRDNEPTTVLPFWLMVNVAGMANGFGGVQNVATALIVPCQVPAIFAGGEPLRVAWIVVTVSPALRVTINSSTLIEPEPVMEP